MLPLLPNGSLAPMVSDHRRVSVSPLLVKGETHLTFFSSDDDNKAMTVQLKDSGSFVLYRYMVCCFFDIPCVEAARIMCVSLSLVKRIRSWAKLDCWPCCLIHSGTHPRFTREWVVQRRDEVILSLERKFIQQPSSMLGLTVGILKNVRQYAKIYLGLVVPGTGRRGMVEKAVKPGVKILKKPSDKEELKIKVKLSKLGKKGRVVKELMESMKPRHVGSEKNIVEVAGESLNETSPTVAPAPTPATPATPTTPTTSATPTTPATPTPTTPVNTEETQLHPLQEEWIGYSPSSSLCQDLDTLYAIKVEDELGLGPICRVFGRDVTSIE